MATFTKFVNTASSAGGTGDDNTTSGAGRAYVSLSDWEANVSGAATDTYTVDCCGTAADTTAVTISFATHITTGTVTIRGNRSHSAGFYTGNSTISTAHYRLAPAANSSILIGEPKVTIDGIQVECSGGAFTNAIQLGTPNGITIKKCRLRAAAATDSGIGTGGSTLGASGVTTIENNLIVGFNVQGVEYKNDNFWNPQVTIRHNTIYGDGSSKGIYIQEAANGDGDWIIKANAFGNTGASNCFDITLGSTGTVTYADNATEDAQGTTDEFAIGVLTNAWTSPGTGQASDFSVKNTSSSLYNTVNPTLVTDDITDFTRDGANHDAGAFEWHAAATAVTMSGPSSGGVGIASSNFTIGVDATPITGTVVVTPSDSSGGGTFTPTTVSLTTGSPTQTFTYTAASVGVKTISVTNDGGLANPSNISYSASIPPQLMGQACL